MNGKKYVVQKTVLLFMFLILVGCLNITVTEDSCVPANKNSYSIDIVEIPEYSVVTNQIAKSFVGRWELDRKNYFEIREDGSFTVSSTIFEPVVYTEKEMDLVAYYSKANVESYEYEEFGISVIEFRLRQGYNGAGLMGLHSLCYWLDYSYTDGEMLFIDFFNEEYKKGPLSQQAMGVFCEQKYSLTSDGLSEVVDTVEYNVLTNRILKELIGRYTTEPGVNTKEYFEIKKDGSYIISIFDMHEYFWKKVYRFFTEEDAEFVAYYYENGDCYFEFRLKIGEEALFPFDMPRLSIDFSNNNNEEVYSEYWYKR